MGQPPRGGRRRAFRSFEQHSRRRPCVVGPNTPGLEGPGGLWSAGVQCSPEPPCAPHKGESVGRAQGSSSPRPQPTPRPAREACGNEAPQPKLGALHPSKPLVLLRVAAGRLQVAASAQSVPKTVHLQTFFGASEFTQLARRSSQASPLYHKSVQSCASAAFGHNLSQT